MNADRKSLLKEQFLDEIWDEISSQRGKELDEYLADIGLNPDNLLQMYEKGLDIAFTAAKRVRFEEARRSVRARAASGIAKIAAFDLAKKKQIMAAIRERTTRTHEMTIAARNQKIDAEQDLDSFLEACVLLGVIDEEGNLKE